MDSADGAMFTSECAECFISDLEKQIIQKHDSSLMQYDPHCCGEFCYNSFIIVHSFQSAKQTGLNKMHIYSSGKN